MSRTLVLATVAFNVPWAISEQIRLLKKNLTDDYSLIVFDNSSDYGAAGEIKAICSEAEVTYIRVNVEDHEHYLALQIAAQVLQDREEPYIGFLDHDVFPTAETSIVSRVAKHGFYGIGQRHAPTGRGYLWPGFCFFSREWLSVRKLDFNGIRGDLKRNDGDTGSANWPLFVNTPWDSVFTDGHGYRYLREPDSHGLQSYGYEVFGDIWIHLTNTSNWKDIPNPEERDRLARSLIGSL